MKVAMELNGQTVALEVEHNTRLLDALRLEGNLTGTKEGCGEGECGACTVWIDGVPVNSCLVLAAQVRGKQVTTVEGLGNEDRLSKLQQKMVDLGGTQCGICTPGILMTAEYLKRKMPNATRTDIREKLAGNICRCTGYQLIVDAVEEVMNESD